MTDKRPEEMTRDELKAAGKWIDDSALLRMLTQEERDEFHAMALSGKYPNWQLRFEAFRKLSSERFPVVRGPR